MTYEEQRILFDVFAETIEEWQGVPVPLPELPVILHNRHPMQQAYRKIQQELDGGFEIEIHVGGPGHEPVVAGGPDEEEHIRNVFHSRREQATRRDRVPRQAARFPRSFVASGVWRIDEKSCSVWMSRCLRTDIRGWGAHGPP
jgi:hypothetical protein